MVKEEECKKCKFWGNASDVPGVEQYDCLYDLDPDKDEDGFVILAPPCYRNSEESDSDEVENLPFS